MLKHALLFTGLALLTAAPAAHADVMTTYQLGGQDLQCSPPAGCSATTTPTGPYGTVMVDQTSAGSATITVNLAPGFTFNNAGDALEFEGGTADYPDGNLPHSTAHPYPIQITGATTGFELDPPPPVGSVFGPFNVGVKCNYTGGACDSTTSTAASVSFTVSSDDGVLNFLEAAGGGFFASDVTTSVDYQSFIVRGACTTKTATYQGDVAATPEPSSLMLLGTGILGAAGALRRRIKA